MESLHLSTKKEASKKRPFPPQSCPLKRVRYPSMLPTLTSSALAVPIYVDTVLALQGAIRDKFTKIRTSNEAGNHHRDDRSQVRRHARPTKVQTASHEPQ